jgi:hypothetical protein
MILEGIMVDLIRSIAGHYYKKMRSRGLHVEREELMGEVGLCYAIALKRHDPKRGPFKKYVRLLVRQHIGRMTKEKNRENAFFEKIKMLKNEGCIF